MRVNEWSGTDGESSGMVGSLKAVNQVESMKGETNRAADSIHPHQI